MTPLEEVKNAVENFEKVQYEYRNYGAFDTEPSSEWHYSIYQTLKNNKVTAPRSGDNWQLFTASMKCGEATRVLNKVSRESLKIILKYKKDIEVRKFLNDYCWRVTLHNGDIFWNI